MPRPECQQRGGRIPGHQGLPAQGDRGAEAHRPVRDPAVPGDRGPEDGADHAEAQGGSADDALCSHRPGEHVPDDAAAPEQPGIEWQHAPSHRAQEVMGSV